MKQPIVSQVGKRRGSQSAFPRIITLLTDFGLTDYYVGAMKGIILSIAPHVRLVDITHDVPPQNIASGAFYILAAHTAFPNGTVHLGVVDPGVGSGRRAIAVQASGQFFIGPDNGLFSYICQADRDHRVFEITNQTLFRRQVSETFHGRDVFAPVAAHLALGIDLKALGKEIQDYVDLGPLEPKTVGLRRFEGRIINVDRFGNCVTNFTPNLFSSTGTERRFQLTIAGRKLNLLKRFYAEPPVKRREPFAIWGSAGFLEIATTNGSAARILRITAGDQIELRFL
ncbi:MAG TPA: SAM-dependent chlorinase/fluorinase [Pyrinomonadaceae bacterium]|nr:SAM-dependent chlorinase/fluorinase [Pyrinomonadaceae bacterium]